MATDPTPADKASLVTSSILLNFLAKSQYSQQQLTQQLTKSVFCMSQGDKLNLHMS